MHWYVVKMKGVVATGAQVLLYLPFVLTLSLSSEITFSSHWADNPVCAGFTLEMTCIVHLTDGINTVSKVTVIKDRGMASNMYCNVWPVPEGGEARCGSSSNEGTMNLMVNGTTIDDNSLIILIVLQSVQEIDGGGYECSVGTDGSGNLAKVSTTTLTLDVRDRSRCKNLPEIPLSRSLVVNSTNFPMCIFSVMPSSVPLWMTGNEYVSNNTVKFIKSGDYIATWINFHQLKSNDVYSCELKLNKYKEDVIQLHTFQKPTIKFYPTDSCSNGYLFCIEVWVISSSPLLSPITCTVDDNFEVRYVGSRSAVVSSCLDEFELLSNSSLLCEASNQFGRSENTLNVSSITISVPEEEDVHTKVETSTTDQISTSVDDDTNEMPSTLPKLFRNLHGVILFSVLVFLVVLVVTCLGICGWKIRSDHKTRLNQRMKEAPFKDGYWSFLPKENKQRNITERALPHRPDSVYASCETGLSVAIPAEEKLKCPAKPPLPLGYVGSFGPNNGQTQDNVKCQFCSCKTKFETNTLPSYTCHDKIELPANEQNYLTKEDFRSGYIVPLAEKQERDITFNTYEMNPYSKLFGSRRPEGNMRRSHSVLYVSPPVVTSDEELNRNRKYSF